MKKISTICAIVVIALQMTSCTKNSETPAPTVTWTKTVTMSAKFELPAVANRNETATATLELLSNNTLKYNIVVTGLASSDALAAAHVHVGNAGVNGGVYIPLEGTFSGSTVSGTTGVLRSGQIDSLKTVESYVNVHSTQAPGGLVRGQVDSKVVFAADVVMTGASEVPAVTTTATGLATIRMTEDKKAYLKVVISNLETTDVLSAAHIHAGATGVNGGVILGFYSAAADFGTLKIMTATDAVYNSILNDAVYVNAHSTTRPGGIVRGQIR